MLVCLAVVPDDLLEVAVCDDLCSEEVSADLSLEARCDLSSVAPDVHPSEVSADLLEVEFAAEVDAVQMRR